MNPVTLNDLSMFFANILSAYNQYLFFGLTLMFAAHLLILTRRLLVGYK